MPFCPKCKAEYEEGAKTCAHCGEALVEKLPEQAAPHGTAKIEGDAEAFLVSIEEGFIAQMIEGSLCSAGIPYVIKRSHIGAVGFIRFDGKDSGTSKDFYVPAKLLERAKALLPVMEGASGPKADEDASANGTDADKSDFPDHEFGNLTNDGRPSEHTGEGDNFPEEGQEGRRHTGAAGAILFIVLAALVIFGVDYVMNLVRSALGY